MALIAPKQENELDEKEWKKVLDRYLVEKKMASEEYERMSLEQIKFIQELKRAFKRIKKDDS